METPVLQVCDLFLGQLKYEAPKKRYDTSRCEPFSLAEIDMMLPEFPEVMLYDLEVTCRNFRRAKEIPTLVDEEGDFLNPQSYFEEHGEYPQSDRISVAKSGLFGTSKKNGCGATQIQKRFYDCVSWVFDLHETPSRIPFEQACLNQAIDPEVIRTNLANGFADDIREFVNLYCFACPSDSNRVKALVRAYIILPK